MAVEPTGQQGWVTTRLDFLVNWARAGSLWPMPFGTACCAIEFMAVAASRFDLSRFGMERLGYTPRQADVLICAGRVPFKLAPVIRRIWQQMPQPKWCISMGACASTGGMFDNYAVVQGIDTIIPVDVYVPGCPPRPEGLMYGILMIQEKIRRSSPTRDWVAEENLEEGLPAIVLLNDRGYRHFVVVKGLRDGRVLLGDLARGTRAMSRARFEALQSCAGESCRQPFGPVQEPGAP